MLPKKGKIKKSADVIESAPGHIFLLFFFHIYWSEDISLALIWQHREQQIMFLQAVY